MNKRFLFCILLFFAAASTSAQKKFEYIDSTELYSQDTMESTITTATEDPPEKITENDIQGDTAVNLHQVSIASDSLRAWKNKKEFAYARNLDSLLRAQNKEEDDNRSNYRERTPNATNMDKLFDAGWIKALLWGIAGCFVLYILYQLFSSKGNFRKSGDDRQVKEYQPDPDELPLLSNFDKLIHEACRQGDYRVATRYLFLKTLQKLNDRSLISFSIDKTNSRYLYEVPESKRAEFAPLITTYEYLWYGNNTADKMTYTGIEAGFNNFLNKI